MWIPTLTFHVEAGPGLIYSQNTLGKSVHLKHFRMYIQLEYICILLEPDEDHGITN